MLAPGQETSSDEAKPGKESYLGMLLQVQDAEISKLRGV
jgi:hypothetical protein